MKTIAFLLTLSFFTASHGHTSFKADDEPVTTTRKALYKKMVHFNPLALIIGGLELGYEIPTSGKESFLVQAGYYLSEEAGFLDLKDDYSNMNGFRLEMQYRFYRKNNNYIRNVFIAPFVNLKTLSADHRETIYQNNPPTTIEKTTTYSASTVGIGYMLGSRKSIYENIYLDLSIGGGVFFPVSGEHHKQLHIGLFNPYQKGVQFKAGFGLLIAL